MMPKPRYPRADALAVAKELCDHLRPVTGDGRLIVAGSLRRRKALVGDVEILFVPKFQVVPDGLFDVAQQDLAAMKVDELRQRGIVEPRLTKLNRETWGPQNKLAVHVASGIPVDFFTATAENWWNYLVCRTGPAESNTRICVAAIIRGWIWRPYSPGFYRAAETGAEVHPVTSEREVFDFVGLPYKVPWER